MSDLYTYAVVATFAAIFVVGMLSWLASKVGGSAAIIREVNG